MTKRANKNALAEDGYILGTGNSEVPAQKIGRPMSDVDEYVSKVDPKLRRQFQKLRSIVKNALPGASESVKWGVPYYSLNGVGVASLGDYTKHVNLYFMQGAKLSSDLLKGTGKGMRHITIKTLAEMRRQNSRGS